MGPSDARSGVEAPEDPPEEVAVAGGVGPRLSGAWGRPRGVLRGAAAGVGTGMGEAQRGVVRGMGVVMGVVKGAVMGKGVAKGVAKCVGAGLGLAKAERRGAPCRAVASSDMRSNMAVPRGISGTLWS